jgi:hypothetical protein
MDPKKLLRDFLASQEIRAAEFARRIDYDKGNFHRLLNDTETWPTLDLAFRIDRETQGAVPMSSWAEAKAA